MSEILFQIQERASLAREIAFIAALALGGCYLILIVTAIRSSWKWGGILILTPPLGGLFYLLLRPRERIWHLPGLTVCAVTLSVSAQLSHVFESKHAKLESSYNAKMSAIPIDYYLGMPEAENQRVVHLLGELLDFKEKYLGDTHPELISELYSLAICNEELGEFEDAAHFWFRGLAILEGYYGDHHPETVQLHLHIGEMYFREKKYKLAVYYYEEARNRDALRRERGMSSDQNGDYIRPAWSGLLIKKYAIEEPWYAETGVQSEKHVLDRAALEAAVSPFLSKAGVLERLRRCYEELETAARYEDALQIAQSVLVRREQLLGAFDPLLIESLLRLARYHEINGAYPIAERLLQRASELAEQSTEDPILSAKVNLALMSLFSTLGRSKDASLPEKRIQEWIESESGGLESDSVASLKMMRVIGQAMAGVGDAEAGVSIYETLFASFGLSFEESVRYKRDYLNELRRTGPVVNDSYEARSRELSKFYEEMAAIYSKAGELESALLFEIAAISFRGPYDWGYIGAASLRIARIRLRIEDPKSWESAALAFETKYAKLAGLLGSGTAGFVSQRPPMEVMLYGLEAREKSVEVHPDTAEILYELAVEFSRGSGLGRSESEASERTTERSQYFGWRYIEIMHEYLGKILPYYNEAALLDYSQSLKTREIAGQFLDAAKALQTQLWFKGLVLDETSARMREQSRLLTSETGKELADELEALRSEIHLAMLDPDSGDDDLEGLEQAFESKRLEVSEHLVGSFSSDGRRALSVKVEDVQRELRKGEVLIEWFRYLDESGRDTSLPRYASLMLSPNGEIWQFDHGTAAALEADILRFRRLAINLDAEVMSLTAAERDRQFAEVSYRLYQGLLGPLQPLLESMEVERLILSPDAQLNFLPFGMLQASPDNRSDLLSGDYELRYVSSGRDLIAQATTGSGDDDASSAVVITDPSYDLESYTVTMDEKGLLSGYDQSLQSLRFAQMPGLAQLAKELPSLFTDLGQECQVLDGKSATESRIRQRLRGQRVVHLATHGFFLPEIQIGPGTKRLRDPMYRSGLAFAGAQNTLSYWEKGQVPEPYSDGILMAVEASNLDLWGTDVLFLGACETAVGDALDGEGVIGLRRALAIAGARNTILTLWSVQDQPTVEFTECFYTKYLGGMNAATALAETQKELYAEWLDQYGYAEAVNRAGAFVCTSLGSVE